MLRFDAGVTGSWQLLVLDVHVCADHLIGPSPVCSSHDAALGLVAALGLGQLDVVTATARRATGASSRRRGRRRRRRLSPCGLRRLGQRGPRRVCTLLAQLCQLRGPTARWDSNMGPRVSVCMQ